MRIVPFHLAVVVTLTIASPAYTQAPMATPGPAAVSAPSAPAPAAVSPPSAADASHPAEPLPLTDSGAGATAAQMSAPNAGMHELSPWSMFLNADIIVKIVMCGLAFASLVTWTVLLAKSTELVSAQRGLKSSLKRIGNVRSLGEAQDVIGSRRNVLSAFLAAAMLEAQLSHDADAAREDGVKERAASSFAEITRSEGRSIRRGMGMLATIGSTAPFVGLFGTVWGIMNSFIGISKSQTTNLAVVAPGIAEALLATAIGLVAAIPAVIIYNHFSRQTRAYLDIVAQASGAAMRLLSRDLDRMHGHLLARAAE